MTANRNFKRRVRERANQTGESYTAALRHFVPEELMDRKNRKRALAANASGDRLAKFTPSARWALEFAQDQARLMNQNYIAPEHVLLGLLSLSQELPLRLLAELGLQGHVLWEDALLVVRRRDRQVEGRFGPTEDLRQALAKAAEAAAADGGAHVTTGHLLVGILETDEEIAAGLAAAADLPVAALRLKTREEANASASEPPAEQPAIRRGIGSALAPATGPFPGMNTAGLTNPPPASSYQRTIALGHRFDHDDLHLRLVSLELYSTCFLITYIVSKHGHQAVNEEAVDWSVRPNLRQGGGPYHTTRLTDDLGREYRAAPLLRRGLEGSGGPYHLRYECQFTPSLDPAAKRLHVVISTRGLRPGTYLRASRPGSAEPAGLNEPPEDGRDRWEFDVELPPDQRE